MKPSAAHVFITARRHGDGPAEVQLKASEFTEQLLLIFTNSVHLKSAADI